MYRTIIPAFLLAITTQAYAGALIVQSDHPEPIVVTVDGTVSGSTPIEIRNLQPGSHDVGYRVGNFARDSFTEKVDVPQDGDVTVFVDLPKRRSTIVYVDPPKKEPAPPPIESTVTTAPQFSSTSGPAGAACEVRQVFHTASQIRRPARRQCSEIVQHAHNSPAISARVKRVARSGLAAESNQSHSIQRPHRNIC